ncbi:MAG: hypothetical protein K6T90_04475 [Leptolyngbyaceae cyanobacterium HOT.MB2.61]|nr:hypothetical protein [Leptolyngbyaceae cyanobacterium HOT.MB2.61]
MTTSHTSEYKHRLTAYALEFTRRVLREDPLSRESKEFLRRLCCRQKLESEHVDFVGERILRYLNDLRLISLDEGQLLRMLESIVQECLRLGGVVTPVDRGWRENGRNWGTLPVVLIASGVCITGVLIAVLASHYLIRPAPELPPAVSPGSIQASPPPAIQVPDSESTPAPETAQSEKEAEQRDRLAHLGVSYQFFQDLLNDRGVIHVFYPVESNSAQQSDAIAQKLYDILAQLSPETRSKLGTYNRNNYDRWLQELGERGPSSPRLDSLTNAWFFQLFPELKGRELNPRTFGQIWFAIAEERLAVARAQQPRMLPEPGTYADRPMHRRPPRYLPGRRVPMSALRFIKEYPTQPVIKATSL